MPGRVEGIDKTGAATIWSVWLLLYLAEAFFALGYCMAGRGVMKFPSSYPSHFKEDLLAIQEEIWDKARYDKGDGISQRGQMGRRDSCKTFEKYIRTQAYFRCADMHRYFGQSRCKEFGEYIGGNCIRSKNEPYVRPAIFPVLYIDRPIANR